MNLAILQARMSSSRLPGKVMAPVLGEPMIGRQVERLRRSKRIDRLMVATSTDPSDDPLALYCDGLGLDVYRGSLTDVLDRYRAAADLFPQAAALVRLTADCPLADPALIDAVIAHHHATDADWTTAALGTRTFPHGLDVEAIRPAALSEAAERATDAYEREHVTPYLYRRPETYRLEGVARPQSLAHLRWTVDLPADLAFVRDVYARLYPADPAFTSDDIVALEINSAPVPA
ncbi:glycosyltransferase family protein [Phenylobacterium sp.]|uniref:glycosyltransferase family protein n=1 Tax=Phenylobacterium sp. TaxID=1871053 RepID=UPI0011F4F932|nr:glycosyltransferase family protein [Phenylobacterium sp.]THD58051.1 MAG: flagellin modification protein FlmC [Phenylobacterium sp.]